ncbi:MAG: siphovirus ReqiPepy6 Gp37-like family protein [Anaerorhabdus sp.]|uniref:siphovirus ReqiPepy6 Gp37-like family protein n=1 Tax=Anaerorhabdus sp. TaxID=1872524 RepID=UPI003A8B1DDE
MELLILDKEFNELGTIDEFNSLQWTRKYYDFGDFDLECSINFFEMIQQGFYLFRQGYELAYIEEIKYKRSDDNEYVLHVSGQFISSMLNDRVIVGEKKFTGTHEVIARQMLNENFINPNDVNRKISNLSLAEVRSLGEDTTLEIKDDEVGEELNSFLEEKELSQRIDYDYLTNQLLYSVWQGLDRTEEQSINTWAVFSDDYDNVADVEYSNDTSDYKNFAYVVGKDNKTITVNNVKLGERRREMIVSSSDSVDADLKTKGTQELDKEKPVEVIDCTVISNENLLYKRDYDLGDLCTIKIRSIDKMANMRITEVREIYEDGEVTIVPKFGDDYITITKFIEREVKK